MNMNEVNNRGRFRTKRRFLFPKNYGRLLVHRSKIRHSITNTNPTRIEFDNGKNSTNNSHFNIRYRQPTAHIRHQRIRRKIFNAAGDQNSTSAKQQQYVDFIELERLFDDAIRNGLPVELYKERPAPSNVVAIRNELLPESKPFRNEIPLSNPITETRIDLSNRNISLATDTAEEINCIFIQIAKRHRVLTAIILIPLAIAIGFFVVFVFVK